MKKAGIVMLLLFIAFSMSDITASEKAEIDKTAPNFILTDSNGNAHSLTDFRGKVVVLEWVNFGCPFVKKHYNSKNMQNLQKKYTDAGVVWLSICSSAEGKQGYLEKEEINDKIAGYGAAMTAYLVDESGKVGKMYDAKTTPHMYVINKDGILVYAGGIDDKASTEVSDIETAVNYVSAALDAVINGKEVNTKVSKPYGCSVKYK
ncbi:MAG: thioredoxin family protein [Melioribacteraceae bacterium]|nr:thioredoxin family protein [Melioribacteraceae bacterium]